MRNRFSGYKGVEDLFFLLGWGGGEGYYYFLRSFNQPLLVFAAGNTVLTTI